MEQLVPSVPMCSLLTTVECLCRDTLPPCGLRKVGIEKGGERICRTRCTMVPRWWKEGWSLRCPGTSSVESAVGQAVATELEDGSRRPRDRDL